MSDIRKRYMIRLVGRIIVFVLCFVICIVKPEYFNILNGMNFFKEFSVLHILWLVWVFDILLQILPIKSKIALGSQKLFALRFVPARKNIKKEDLLNHIASISKSAYIVMVLWIALIAVIGVLYYQNIIDKMILFMISVTFYVCDLICVLIWCPFRFIMKNKCCTTCRIFNWDHLMMFSPMIFILSFYSTSLVVLSFIAFFVWEICILLYPQRFSEMTNDALKCSECTDKLCTQYCQKLRTQKNFSSDLKSDNK